MRDAWKFLLNTVSEPVSFEYWCKLNEYIARNEALEWGKLRTGSVGISGTDYEPPVPNKDKTVAELEAILTDADASTTDKALAAFTWGARGQFFWDGNKRTSLMLANLCLKSVARYAATSMIEDYRIRYIMDALACSLMITIW